MGPLLVKLDSCSFLRRTARKKNSSRQVLSLFCDATVPSIVFSLFNPGAGQATGISAVGCLVTGGAMILPNVWKEFSTHRKTVLSILLSGLMLCSVITGWIQRYYIFRDCELSIGLYRKISEGENY